MNTGAMEAPMLDLYTWHSPEGRKPAILLAELELPYELHVVEVARGVEPRREPDLPYLALDPYGSIPTLVDRDPHLGRAVVFSAGAILQYLADKYRRFVPLTLGGARADVLSWLGWEGIRPAPLFRRLRQLAEEASEQPSEWELFYEEAKKLVTLLDRRLVNRDFITSGYSIADIACYPSFRDLADLFPTIVNEAHEVKRWLHRVGHRPAVRRGMRLAPLATAA
jgi:GST-like protein